MAWSDREDVDLAQMIRDKVADRKEYIKRFKRSWHDIEIHGSKFMGHDMSFVVSGRKKREHFPMLKDKKEKRKYTRRKVELPKDDGISAVLLGILPSIDELKNRVANLQNRRSTEVLRTREEYNTEIVANWYLRQLNAQVEKEGVAA